MIIEKIYETAAVEPLKSALIYGERYITYKELCDKIEDFLLMVKNIEPNRPNSIILMMDNSLELIVWILVCIKLKIVAILLPPYFKENELQDHFLKLGTKLCVLGEVKINNKFYEVKKESDLFRIVELNVPLSKNPFFEGEAIIQFTSGSEGESKAIVRTLNSVEIEIKELEKFFCYDEKDVFAPLVPLCHSFGLIAGTLFPLSKGLTIAIFNYKFVRDTLNKLKKEKASFIFAAPYFYSIMSEVQKSEKWTWVKKAFVGGGQYLQNNAQLLFQEFQIDVFQDYGSTEMGTMFLGKKPLRLSSALGEALGNAKYYLDDKNNVFGELIIKNDILGFRYLYPSNMNEKKLRRGYYRTGDVIKKEGEELFYMFRGDSNINIAGLKVYPSEVEKVIKEIPDVADVVVFGEKDKKYGELLTAYIVPRGSILECNIKKYCKSKMADYKVPKKIVFVKSLEKNPSGKVLKKYLMEDRKMYEKY